LVRDGVGDFRPLVHGDLHLRVGCAGPDVRERLRVLAAYPRQCLKFYSFTAAHGGDESTGC
jgi:hypothetical protein